MPYLSKRLDVREGEVWHTSTAVTLWFFVSSRCVLRERLDGTDRGFTKDTGTPLSLLVDLLIFEINKKG